MKKLVQFSKVRPCLGKLKAPSSKSALQRIVALSWLSQGETKIINPVCCNDVDAALGMIRSLGAEVSETSSAIYIDSRGKMENLDKNKNVVKLFCGESGLALRMFSSVVSLNNCCFEFNAAGSLSKRPSSIIVETLSQFGVKLSDNGGFPPVAVCGQLAGGSAEIDGSLSSQILTGLLLALPAAKGNSEIKVNNLKSKPYINLTIDLAKKFGCEIINNNYSLFEINGGQKYKTPGIIEAEGDWSSASFLLVAAALSSEGSIEIDNLDIDSKQADKAIVEVLSACGLKIGTSGNNFITLKRTTPLLLPFEFNASECPDLFPPLVALASGCSGTSLIHGVERLKHKESDRELTLLEEFSKAGVDIKSNGKTISVVGGRGIQSFKGNSHNDHRIAMAIAAASAIGGVKVEIENAEAVEKSYPDFYNDLMLIGGQVDE
ncbi:MAG: 3-phosphoshikimate 1-carboxyvinyltransferase [Spirochaetaceae bacterium]|nr:3-phosphoshikimate 1-carboxyvinyltransferase [Spirochaetaceae bacterium]